MQLPLAQLVRIGRAALLLLMAGLALAGPAAAHAVLLETIPADGALLPQTPSRVVLRFNEPITPVALKLFDADGRMLAKPSDVSTRDNQISLALPGPLA